MNHKKGLTLVEVLVVVTILSVLALSVYTVFKSGIDAWSRSEARLDIYQNGRAVLDQIFRELAGAFTGGGAQLTGTPGGSATDPDTLEFVTDFSGSNYKIRYQLVTDASDPAGRKILKRDYIDFITTTGAKDYTRTDYDNSVEFVKYTKSARVDNIKFLYVAVPTPPDEAKAIDDWSGASAVAVNTWSAAALPEAVKIILTLKDANNKSYVFETIVYLPNSEQ